MGNDWGMGQTPAYSGVLGDAERGVWEERWRGRVGRAERRPDVKIRF